jgi:hypothetical protein
MHPLVEFLGGNQSTVGEMIAQLLEAGNHGRFYDWAMERGIPADAARQLLANAQHAARIAQEQAIAHGRNPLQEPVNLNDVHVPNRFQPGAPELPPEENFFGRQRPALPEKPVVEGPDIVAGKPVGEAPGKLGPAKVMEAGGKFMLWITLIDGAYRDIAEWITGKDDPGFLGPALKDTWVGDFFHWVAEHAPATTAVIQVFDDESHFLGAVASIPLFFVQLGEILIRAVEAAIIELADAFVAAAEWLAAAVTDIVEVAVELGTIALDALGHAADQLADGFVAALPHFDAAIDQAGQALGDAAAALGNGLPGIMVNAHATLNAAADLAADAPAAIVQVLAGGPNAAANVAPGIIQRLDAVIENAGATFDAGLQAADNGVQVLVNQVPAVIDQIGSGLDAIGNGLGNAIDTLGNGAQDLADALFGGGLIGAAPAPVVGGLALVPLPIQVAEPVIA